jgi:hypothetical protein
VTGEDMFVWMWYSGRSGLPNWNRCVHAAVMTNAATALVSLILFESRMSRSVVHVWNIQRMLKLTPSLQGVVERV